MTETTSKKHFSNPVNLKSILVGLLVVSAFIIGSLWTKVQYLEKGTTSLVQGAVVAGNQPPDNAATGQPPVPQAAAKKPEVTDKDWYKGNKSAKVAMVEYSDLECPYCKLFHPTMQQAIKEYGDKIKWVYRHFPLDFHANAQKEAEAT